MEVVKEVLKSLELDEIPVLNVYNKIDLLDEEQRFFPEEGVSISAKDASTFPALMEAIESIIWTH